MAVRASRVTVFFKIRSMAEHGPLMSIPTLLALLSADCPKRQAGMVHDVCGAHMPQLSEIFMAKPA
jgi:hypothetical protein